MARFNLEVGFSTDVGKQRQRNEDSYAIFVPFPGEGNPSQLAGLMLVADGMGGERAGDRASQLTAERLRQWFSSGDYLSWPEHQGEQPLEATLVQAIRATSKEIFELGEKDASIRGLGSTVVICAMSARHMVLAHVGDSRCYRIRRGTIEQMTTDHSWVQRQVAAGVLTDEAARRHPQRNILTRSLGDSLPPKVDSTVLDLAKDDVFVLCSDGLTGGVSDEEILEVAEREQEPQAIAEALVRLANEKDGSDNITAVIGRCCLDDEADESLENYTTHRIVLDGDGDGGSDIYDGDTELDIEAPEELRKLSPFRRQQSATNWKTWLVAAIAALTLGLLAGWLVQRTQSSTTSTDHTAGELGPQRAATVLLASASSTTQQQ